MPSMIQARIIRKNHNLLWLLGLIGFVTVLLTLAWSRSSDYLNTISASLPPSLVSNNGHQEDLISEPIALPPSPNPPAPINNAAASITPEEAWRKNVASLLKGKPTEHFQGECLIAYEEIVVTLAPILDNLRPDVQYLTVWVSGGWTNDFMGYINMIYLSTLTGRTPLLPPFAPSHVSWDGGFLEWGDVFDLPRLSQAINSTVIEWRDVKANVTGDKMLSKNDEIGCWSLWSLVSPSEDKTPRPTVIPSKLRLDVSYTGLPTSSVRIEDIWLPFWTLAKLAFSSRRKDVLAEKTSVLTSNQAKNYIEPNEHLMCFDMMYFVGVQDHDEWWRDWSPAWNFVGRHARWNEKLQKLGLNYIHRTLGLKDDGEIPPYIAVHARRGDFLTGACGVTDPEACFNHMVVYAERVASVNKTLASKGIHVPKHNVLVTSDEQDPQWWKEVEDLGWHYTNHTNEKTSEVYGSWYPSILDAVSQSLAIGFVGTQFSTYSLVASRRVRDWRGGVAEFTTLRAFE